MNPDRTQRPSVSHERARQLILTDRVEGISDTEREWLGGHLQECAQCAEEASAVAATIDSLRAAPALARAEIVQRARLAVRRRSAELAEERARRGPLWIAAAVSVVLMVITAPASWWAFAWLARAARVPDPVWQVAFLVGWFLPATILAAIVAWRDDHAHARRFQWAPDSIWGQR